MASSFSADPTSCFEAGAAARAAGIAKSANPFPPRCEHHEAWLEGWSATFDLDEDADPSSSRMSPADDIALRGVV